MVLPHTGSTRQAGPSSVSGLISPSASEAGLESLRHSLARSSGDLGLYESAHTFPIIEDNPSDRQRSDYGNRDLLLHGSLREVIAGSSSITQASHSEDATSPRLPRAARRANDRSSCSTAPLSSRSVSPLPPSPSALLMVSPLSSLSMRDLPGPKSPPSPLTDRRMSSFYDFCGTSFTPPTTSPHLESPRPLETPFLPGQQSMLRQLSRSRRRSGSASQTVPAEVSDPQSGDASNASIVDTRSRPASPGILSHSRSRAGSNSGHPLRGHFRTGMYPPLQPTSHDARSQSRAIPASDALRPHRPSHSGAILARSPPNGLGLFLESEASDTGAEGDAGETPQWPAQYRNRYAHMRSSSHLPLYSTVGTLSQLHGRDAHLLTTPGAISRPASETATPFSDLHEGLSFIAAGCFDIQPRLDPRFESPDRIEDMAFGRQSPCPHFSPWPPNLSTLDAATGSALHCGPHGAHTATELGDFLLPPPPYEAADEVAEIRRRAAQSSLGLEEEQTRAAAGSLSTPQTPFEDPEEFLSSTTQRRIPLVDTTAESGVPATRRFSESFMAPSLLQARQMSSSRTEDWQEVEAAAQLSPTQSRATENPAPDSLPTWQPKSDTENETDATEALGLSSGTAAGDADLRRLRRRRPPSSSSVEVCGHHHSISSPLAKHLAIEEEEDGISPLLLRWLLHPLRMLAAVPGFVGTFWLLRNMRIHYSLSHSLFVRGALNPDDPHSTNPQRLTCGLDFLLASLWAVSTAYHALSLTTLLLRRWLIYYSLLPSLIRMLTLQAICWPLVRLTIFVAGPDRPIEAWTAIASFTAMSDVVARWVTSNIADAPTQRSMPKPPQRPLSGIPAAAAEARSARSTLRSRPSSQDRNGLPSESRGVSSAFLLSSTTMNPMAESSGAHSSWKSTGRLGTGQRFWRAVMGAPLDSSTDSEDEDNDDLADGPLLDGGLAIRIGMPCRVGPSSMTSRMAQRLQALRSASLFRFAGQAAPSGPVAETDDGSLYYGTDADACGDGGETTDAGGMTTAALIGADGEGDEDGNEESAAEAVRRLRAALRRRRRHRVRAKMAAISGSVATGPSTSTTSASARRGGYVRIRSRRVFHWEVAVKRNVAPIGILAYMTLWGIMLGGIPAQSVE